MTSVVAQALGPHECIILVNRRSMGSLELANHYADLRRIPPVNIIPLELPDRVLGSPATLTPDEFRTLIYEPTLKALRERKLQNHVLVWLYSLGFPSYIEANPPMSLTGFTFVRGQPPPADVVANGTWRSPLFLGPDEADGPSGAATSLENFTMALTTNMPLPSMMLGWAGSRGMTVEAIKEQLRVSASSDGSHPSASVYFHEQADEVRSSTRMWQFAPAIRELAGVGVAGFAINGMPDERPDLMGYFGGQALIPPAYTPAFRPGAYADHLTSFAARFHEPDQTKCTAWLRMGAAGTSGTVVEPGSLEIPVILWAKFPTARLFAHYAQGCTLLESLYYSTRNPLQLLMIGDALANPWNKPPGVTLVSMAEDEAEYVKGPAEFLASTWGGFGHRPPTTIFFLDGRPVDQPAMKGQFSIDTAKLFDGYHDLRVVAYANERVRHQGFDQKSLVSRNRQRGVTIGGYSERQPVDLYHPVVFQVKAEGSPREAAIVAQERILARAVYTNGMTLAIQPMQVGAGPVAFQAIALYPDNEPVRSPPLTLDIRALNKPPVIERIARVDDAEGTVTWSAERSDPEGDAVMALWYIDVMRIGAALEPVDEKNVAKRQQDGDRLTLAARQEAAIVLRELDQPNRIKEIAATLHLTDGEGLTIDHRAGIIFNYIDADNYMLWGINGYLSAWELQRMRDGQMESVLTFGAPIETKRDYRVIMASIGDQKMAFFVDDNLVGIADITFGAGKIGLRAGKVPARFEGLLVSPAAALDQAFSESKGQLIANSNATRLAGAIYAAARDVQLTTFKPAMELPVERTEAGAE